MNDLTHKLKAERLPGWLSSVFSFNECSLEPSGNLVDKCIYYFVSYNNIFNVQTTKHGCNLYLSNKLLCRGMWLRFFFDVEHYVSWCIGAGSNSKFKK